LFFDKEFDTSRRPDLLIINKEMKMAQADRVISVADKVVRVGRLLNGLACAAILAGLAATWVVPGFFERMLLDANPAVDLAAALAGVRLLMLIGIAACVAIHRLLVPLGAIVASAGAGDPFVPANAARLEQMGWALLVLQLLDVPAALLARFWPSLGSAAPAGDVSIGGWMATLMLFVLARIFAAGAAMRDDLAGTI
jgi:Protein of unknown function (DUF2975)